MVFSHKKPPFRVVAYTLELAACHLINLHITFNSLDTIESNSQIKSKIIVINFNVFVTIKLLSFKGVCPMHF